MLADALLGVFTDRPDGRFLVIPVGDFVVDGDAQQVFPLGAPGHQLVQVVLAENAADFPLGTALVVPEVGLEPVGGEHHGPPPELPFQAVGIEGSLLSPDVGVLAGALGLHHCQRQSVLPE